MKKRYLLLIGLFFLMSFSAAALAVQVEEIEEASFPLSKEGLVSVESVAGEILVHSWDREEVRMVATKWARASSRARAEELLEALKIKVSSREDKLEISTEFPWWKSLSPFSSVRVDYELWLPLSTEARAESTSGDIGIEERDNNVLAATTSGNISLKGIQGEIEATTISGDIYMGQSKGNAVLHSTSGEIEVEELEGDIDMITTSGTITLEEIRGIVEAHSVSGKIKILGAKGGATSVNTTSGDIWVEFKEVEVTLSKMEFSSTSGDILLALPENLGANVEVKTVSGSIRTEFQVLIEGIMGRGEVRGTIGGGGIRLRIYTTSGDIALRKA